MKLNLEQTFIAELIADNTKIQECYGILSDSSFIQDSLCAGYYEAILSTFDKHGSVDLLLIGDELKARKLDVIKLSDWVASVSLSVVNPLVHAKQIAEKYMKRIGAESLRSLHEDFRDNPDPFESIDEAISTLTALRSQFKKESAVSMATVAGETFEELESIRKGHGSFSLPFGFHDIDFNTGGMDKKDLVIIAALEKRGKTSLTIQTLFHNAQNGIPCLFFSTEMSRKQIMLRYALMVEKLPYIKVKNNQLNPDEWERLFRRINILGSYPVFIRDSVLNIADITSDAERFVSDRGVKLVAVDYIQRVVPISRKNENREREIAAISSGLKNIAIKCDVPVIALSQLNEDLRARESRSIEQDMDKMITINSEKDDVVSADGRGVTIGIKIRQRMGMSGGFGDASLYYDRMNGMWLNSTNASTLYGGENDRNTQVF